MTETKVCIHPVHRRLAEICMKHSNLFALYENLTAAEIQELWQCLKRNADQTIGSIILSNKRKGAEGNESR
ncbi:DUF7667 family protein [Paenibacillus larvae]|uniref:Uncharacterized protein n=8 Tax=root TaxID=1 RepID=A0A345ARS3_9CAUD|nr:hypothetical protein [Paenibacillus larvae]YP_009838670.1 hypothetical protein HWB70_gp39 [Paenibacillus phage Yyerffej]YP_009838942.1 hypothetical protein HWB74_gp39 [Paenibacillus phage Jacopo]AXF40052.1 hypothetical protein BLOOM_39 [Paenibacillus phage Bloom]AXF40411.1 hypothetical protein LYCANUS1_39 [Paenibacillus phage Genki]AXF42278.1 hypothetical protein LYCANUS2_39 [Paenibacillus phage Gryphonian]AXH45299.1 hypothetical protein ARCTICFREEZE_39 [Paenibacillus phage Arcticfreeze]A